MSLTTLPESRAYALLAHQRRRLMLRLLEDFATPLSPMELAELIADCELETPTDPDRTRVLLSLTHNHLPRLSEAGVVDYDPDRGTVDRGPNFGALVGTYDEWAERNGPFTD